MPNVIKAITRNYENTVTVVIVAKANFRFNFVTISLKTFIENENPYLKKILNFKDKIS
jgi:hypothetical protein